MGMIIDRLIMVLAYVIILSSYKKNIKIQKYCIFYFTYIVVSILLECILNGVIGTIEIIALNCALCYTLLRIIMRESCNILELFFFSLRIFYLFVIKKIHFKCYCLLLCCDSCCYSDFIAV